MYMPRVTVRLVVHVLWLDFRDWLRRVFGPSPAPQHERVGKALL